jgi:hypothetical protein
VSEKANPLDRLTRPGGPQLADDESIPVLTERLTLPSLELDVSLPQPPPPLETPPAALSPGASATVIPVDSHSAAPSVAPRAAPVPTYASAPPVQELDWDAVEQALRDAVFRELQPALADDALRLLRDRLQPAVERALQVTASELRLSFEARLRDAIGRAVRAEIARLREPR